MRIEIIKDRGDGNVLYLRPHHINCIFFYRGLGYDEKFKKNMNTITGLLKIKGDTEIKLINNCDDLCMACPNNKKCICESEEHVRSFDKKTLKEYKLKIGAVYTFNEIVKKIYTNFDYNKLISICGDCEWFKQGVCSKEIIQQQEEKWTGTSIGEDEETSEEAEAECCIADAVVDNW